MDREGNLGRACPGDKKPEEYISYAEMELAAML